MIIYILYPVCAAANPPQQNETAISTEVYTPTDHDKQELLLLIKACADLTGYDAAEYDTDQLMRDVLYTHRNFMWLTEIKPESRSGYNGLNLCSADYIQDIMHRSFRIDAPEPAFSELNSKGYALNRGMYYWSGGYTAYYATEVHDIVQSYSPDSCTLNVVYSDTFIEQGKDKKQEYSSASFKRDAEGWYLTAIHPGGSPAPTQTAPAQTDKPNSPIDTIRLYLPFIVALLALAAIGLVIYFYLLKP